MADFTTTRIISIIKVEPKGREISFQEKEDISKKVMEGKGHLGEGVNYWEFIEKNRWGLNTRMGNKDDVIYGSFGIVHNSKYNIFLCTKCEGQFCLPFEYEECIFCGNKELKKDTKNVRMGVNGRPGVQDGVNPELYEMAVKDIQEHGQAPSGPDFEPDWDYLEKNI